MTHIFHFTHIDNLPSILAAGGLRCDRLRLQNQDTTVGIAHQHIKDRRAKRKVNKAAFGTLADYVPFYFAARSPMLYTIRGGNVLGYAGGQEPVVHLVSSVETAVALGTPWCFSDGHADMGLSVFYDDMADLDRVDWKVMRSKLWFDTDDEPDRKRRRQAEFLVHNFFPWSASIGIGVINKTMKGKVEAILTANSIETKVYERPGFYY